MYSLQPALYELSFSPSDDQPNLQQQQNLSQTPKKHKALPAKSHNTPLKCSVRTLQAPHSNKIWSIAECERIIANYTSPVGKVMS